MYRGPSIKYVCSEGGEGVEKLADFADSLTEGGKGVKNPENFADVLNGSPLPKYRGTN